MMKKVLLVMMSMMVIVPSAMALEFWPGDETILTSDAEDVVSADISDSDDIINDGINAIGGGEIKGIYDGEITDNASAWGKMTELMSGFINYALSIIGLVALGYLIFNGFITLTAGADEERAQRGRKGIRTAAIAIFGIALSRFILSLIFFLLFTITS